MQTIIPQKLKELAAACPFKLYAVGGAVRDHIAGLRAKHIDWDICAPALCEDFGKVARALGFELTAGYASTGSLKLRCENVSYEFTSFRTDEYGGEGHAPSSVCFTDDICADARRRDFTCNAVYYNIYAGQFVDPLGGIADIAARRLVPCAPPKKLFCEDAVRILRLARFCGELGFAPDGACIEGARSAADRLSGIAPAILWRELCGILHADEKYGLNGGCGRALRVLNAVGALNFLFPDLATLGEECVERAICAAGRADKEVRLPAFVFALGGDGAAWELKRYPLSKSEIARCARLIELAHFEGDEEQTRLFIVRNYDCFGEVCALRRAVYGRGSDDGLTATLNAMKEEGAPLALSRLNVRGDELIAAGVPPRAAGKTLAYLLERCALDGALNKKGTLLDIAKEYCSGN